MRHLGTVFWFELKRTVTKKSFWIRTMAIPVMVALLMVLIVFSNKVSSDEGQKLEKSRFSLMVMDDSGLVSPAVLGPMGAQTVARKDDGVAAVRAGRVDAFVHFPRHPATEATEIFAKDDGLMNNGKYSAVAQNLMQASVAARLGSADELALLQTGITTKLTAYHDGEPTKGFGRVVAPGLFLVLFYVVIVLLGNQMLTSTTEEKENRVVEMILTSVSARALIWGKIWSLVVMGVIQVAAIMTPLLIAYFGFRSQLRLPSFDLAQVSLAPGPILAGAALFVGGFVMFTALLVAIGSAVPSAKEASGYFSGVVILIFLPFYAMSAVITSPDQLVVQVLSFFPLTSPITLMIRNAVGNIETWQLLAAVVVNMAAGVGLMALAVRTFRYGSLEYARKLGLREMLTRRN